MILSKRAESLTGSHRSPTWQKTTTAIANRMLNSVIPAEAATSRPPGTPTRTRHRRFGSTRWVYFGVPAVGGISTEAIAGQLDGGASLEEVADDFGLGIDAVRWAQSYELPQRACAAA